MTSYVRCKAITKANTQCSRAAVKNNLCTQHAKIECKLPVDITKNVLSDYIEYDELKTLTKSINDLNIRKGRKIVTEDNVTLSSERPGVEKDTIIDGVVRIRERYTGDMTRKLSIERYDSNKKLHGTQWRWYEDGGKKSEKIVYNHGVKNGEYKEWFHNGKLKLKGTYVNDTLKGLYMEYFEDGTLYYKTWL